MQSMVAPSAGQRVMLFSERGLETRKWQTLQYEFEDVVAEVDGAHVLAPPPAAVTRRTTLARRARRVAGRSRPTTEPAITPVTVDGTYDLFFGVFTFLHDIAHLERLGAWRDRCGKAICFLFELFSHEVEEQRSHLELLRKHRFDHIFVFMPKAADRVAEITGAPCTYMPVGVDALRFSPYPSPPPRTVDFYGLGRRSPVTHAAALDLAQRDNAFYIYDTVFDVPVPDHRAHRDLVAEIMKRSRYFFSYAGREDVPRAKADDTLSARYFEGIGGGAVLLGSEPRSPEYRQTFPWPDATITIPYDAHNLREIVGELDAHPGRVARARMNNILGTLRQLDWVYRWAQVLDVAGLPHTAAMHERMERLETLAGMAEEREGDLVAALS